MEIFFGQLVNADTIKFDTQESLHIVKVMRHKENDHIYAMDGSGVLFECILLTANSNNASAHILSSTPGWGTHNYDLTLAVCPTKNNERFEWLGEKATEIGLDTLAPIIGEKSERKVYKIDRMKRIVLSAAKQSLKAKIPTIEEPQSVIDFIKKAPSDALKLIAHCFEEEKISIQEALEKSPSDKIIILIGPEGDFSTREVDEALKNGFIPVHMGNSRLRTETAGLYAVFSVYNKYM